MSLSHSFFENGVKATNTSPTYLSEPIRFIFLQIGPFVQQIGGWVLDHTYEHTYTDTHAHTHTHTNTHTHQGSLTRLLSIITPPKYKQRV